MLARHRYRHRMPVQRVAGTSMGARLGPALEAGKGQEDLAQEGGSIKMRAEPDSRVP